MSRESGKLSPISKEAYFLRDTLSEIVGGRYEIREASTDYPPPAHKTTWYVAAFELEELSKTRHAHNAWEDVDRNIYMESMYLGNTTEWIMPKYGEEGLSLALRLDFRDFSVVREVFAEKFPYADEHLRDYERMLSEVSSKHGVELHIRFAGDIGVATFFMNAEISAKGLDDKQKAEQIKLNVKALKEAWERIDRYERK